MGKTLFCENQKIPSAKTNQFENFNENTVKISNIPNSLNFEQILQFFGQFGSIEDFYVCHNNHPFLNAIDESQNQNFAKNEILFKNDNQNLVEKEHIFLIKYKNSKDSKKVINFVNNSPPFYFNISPFDIEIDQNLTKFDQIKIDQEKIDNTENLSLIKFETYKNNLCHFRHTIYIRNLPQKYEDKDLIRIFSKFGQIKSVHIENGEFSNKRSFEFNNKKDRNNESPDEINENGEQKKDDGNVFKSENRKIGFVVFCEEEGAKKAVSEMERIARNSKNFKKKLFVSLWEPKCLRKQTIQKRAAKSCLKRLCGDYDFEFVEGDRFNWILDTPLRSNRYRIFVPILVQVFIFYCCRFIAKF
ncbi:hypothetical protein MHBO_000020 [Bonamia ostreae]|uniref:RRM domain-containing protein n=1 Tax=Bonamia ostreae TaxID=126728 RepID=A0ABV2AE26_9EUKA